MDLSWTRDFRNVLLIRDPAEVVASYVRSRESCEPEDIGLLQQVRLLDVLRSGSELPRSSTPATSCATPRRYLRWLCDWLGIPFTARMLQLAGGPAQQRRRVGAVLVRRGAALDRVRAVAPPRGVAGPARRRRRGGLPARPTTGWPRSDFSSDVPSARKLAICTLWAGDLPGRVTAGSRVTGTVAPSRGHLHMHLRHRRHRSAIALTAGLLAVVTGVSTTTTASFAAGQHRPHAGAEQHSDPGTDARGGFDARRGSGDKARAALLRDAARAASRPETRRFRGSLGDQTLLDLDGATGTPRLLTRLDGFLTGRSRAERRPGHPRVRRGPPRRPRPHHPRPADLPPAPRLRRHRRHPPPVVDAEDRRRRRCSATACRPRSPTTAGCSASAARRSARHPPPRPRPPGIDTGDQRHRRGPQASSGETPSTPGHATTARQVLFVTARRHLPRPGRRSPCRRRTPTLTVVDAATGRLLFRRPLSSDADPRSTRPGPAAADWPTGTSPAPPAAAARCGRLHRPGLARPRRHQAVRQQLAHLLRRERRPDGRTRRGGRAEVDRHRGTTRSSRST